MYSLRSAARCGALVAARNAAPRRALSTPSEAVHGKIDPKEVRSKAMRRKISAADGESAPPPRAPSETAPMAPPPSPPPQAYVPPPDVSAPQSAGA
jgi:hypothetical protein